MRPARRDTAFAAAALAVAVAAANSNDCPLVDSVTREFDARSRQLDRIDRLTLRIATARCRGRNEEMLRLTLERADLDPGNPSEQMSAAAAASWANRPTTGDRAARTSQSRRRSRMEHGHDSLRLLEWPRRSAPSPRPLPRGAGRRESSAAGRATESDLAARFGARGPVTPGGGLGAAR